MSRDRLRFRGRRRVAVALLLVLTALPVLRGQPVPAPEEPQWTDSSSNEPVTLDQELSTPDIDLLPIETQEPAPASESSAEAPPFTSRPSAESLSPPASLDQQRAEQAFTEQEIEPALDDPDLGMPADEGWHLPDFTNPEDPFFQMQGLKIRLGEVHIRMSLRLSFSYDDNIFDRNQDRVGDYITRISPTFVVGIGDFRKKEENYFALSYTPQPEFFAINTQQNTVNEFLTFQGQYAFPRLVTSIAFVYRKDSNPNEDEIGRTENTDVDVTWSNSYALGAKTFLEWGLNGQYRDLGRSIDYTTLSTDLAIAYQYSPKTRLSLGPVAGITFVEGGGEQPFQGVNLRVNYDTLKKFSFRGMIGVQARQFEGPNPSGQEDYMTPTFALGSTYELSERTSFTLDLSRTVGNSGLVRGQSVITNRARVGIDQRILSRLRLSLDLRYDILEYQGTGTNERTDNYIAVRPALNYEFWNDQCALSLFYDRRQRVSEIEGRNFYSNSFGIALETKF